MSKRKEPSSWGHPGIVEFGASQRAPVALQALSVTSLVTPDPEFHLSGFKLIL